jgi:hypothetical protein
MCKTMSSVVLDVSYLKDLLALLTERCFGCVRQRALGYGGLGKHRIRIERRARTDRGWAVRFSVLAASRFHRSLH